ncbi:MAG: cobyrinate a,c-diamide synthase [Methylococcales bacterium]|nr:cobyrinate a,c-diamide synthase [Methylococcales bacterium]
MKIALLAGTQSGCGKTTIMLALLQYLKQQQKNIVSFKTGPDFLDPMWHQLLTDQVSYNLDTRMVGLNESKKIINKQHQQNDLALIEGVMGLFDGRTGVGQDGSSADLAKGLNCPVILVVNAKGMSGSIVPLVSGFCDYANKMGVNISGIIANQVGSAHHASLLKSFLADYHMPPLLAWMEKESAVLAERHLGLVAPDQIDIPNFLTKFHVDDDALSLAFIEWSDINQNAYPIEKKLLINKKIAIAKDAACCFIYQANIDWLQDQGANVCYFSVIKGEAVPSDADALWLPGGYPELYAQQLSVSNSWDSIRRFIEADKPVLAECGGSMLLGKQLIDITGTVWAMAGILPYRSKMQKKLASLGYREEASGIRGHEFHYSSRECEEQLPSSFECSRGDQGIRYKNLRASYIHWYFASAPKVISAWLA